MVTFDPGETRKCIQFSAITDAFKEDAEDIDLSITLMEQANVSLGDAGQTTVTIIDTTGKCNVCMHVWKGIFSIGKTKQ